MGICWLSSGPAGGAGGRTALVVAVAAVHGFSADRSERDFGRNPTAVARHADHLALAGAAVAVTRCLPLVAAVLAALRLVGESALGIERLLVLAEHELLSAIGTIEALIVES